MNAQERMIDRRTFRIAAIAVAAVAVLVLAAYLFGNGLRADTSALGASSADVRAAALAAQAQRRADFHADQGNSARATVRAAALAAQAQRRSDFYADVNNSAKATTRAAALVALAKSRADFYADQNAAAEAARWAAAAADPYNQEWMGFTSPESVGASLPSVSGAGASGAPSIKPEGTNPATAVDSAAKEYPWIKPEGISTAGAK
jgi:hypothetical protein